MTFHPPLYLQRRGWVLDIMRREGVREVRAPSAVHAERDRSTGTLQVVDIGCGEGELLACLCNPAPWLPPERNRATPPATDPDPDRGPDGGDGEDGLDAAALAALHRDVLHPTRVAGLDVCASELAYAAQITAPRTAEVGAEEARAGAGPVRWAPLDVALWEGSVARVNEAFVGAECVVAMEV